jgi:plastocyanin domain-containing protein
MASMAKNATATGMKCLECSKGGKAAPVAGSATVENGVQVIKISLKDGQYVPNQFTVQSSMPVKVSFEGTATDCLGHPTFRSLNKTADLTTAPATLDLGTLKPGTYKFSCAMGMNSGTISVQ